MRSVDLHVHSTKSDGTFTPAELVEYAVKKNLAAFALTDHDTTEGIEEALAASKGKDIEVIPGIEFSTEYEQRDIHLLGLYIDYKSDVFQNYITQFQDSRTLRNKKMCQKLTEHGIPITYDELMSRFPGAVITRAHYAKFLLSEGYVRSMKEAFERYIGDHAPCFLPREKVTPVQAIELILRCGGLPILAHPTLYGMGNDRLEKLIQELKSAGLVGIECIYSTYSTADERRMKALAAKYDLLISGGSDFHGDTKPGLDLGIGYGKLYIHYSILEALKMALPHKSYPILFADMDGTLLNTKGLIDPIVYDAIDSFIKSGGHLVLSSGRPIASILGARERLKLLYPNMYIIAFNGGMIYDCDAEKALYEECLSISDTKAVLSLANELGIHCQVYSDKQIILKEDNDYAKAYKQHILLPLEIINDIPAYLDLVNPAIFKLLAIDGSIDKLDEFSRSIDKSLGQTLSTVYSSKYEGKIYLEIISKKSSKGNAVEFLCNYLNIPIASSIAVGDASNDYSMIKTAGIGVAMQNGEDEIKEIADYVTNKTNAENGILEVFEKWLNITL